MLLLLLIIMTYQFFAFAGITILLYFYSGGRKSLPTLCHTSKYITVLYESRNLFLGTIQNAGIATSRGISIIKMPTTFVRNAVVKAASLHGITTVLVLFHYWKANDCIV